MLSFASELYRGDVRVLLHLVPFGGQEGFHQPWVPRGFAAVVRAVWLV